MNSTKPAGEVKHTRDLTKNAPGKYAVARGYIVTANADGEAHLNSRIVAMISGAGAVEELAEELCRAANASADLLASAEIDDAEQSPVFTMAEYHAILRQHGWDGNEEPCDFRARFRAAALAKAKGASQ